MAEIRKHTTGSGRSAIALQVEAVLGAGVRPVTPGARPRPGHEEPGGTPGAPGATSGVAGSPASVPLASAASRVPFTWPRQTRPASGPESGD